MSASISTMWPCTPASAIAYVLASAIGDHLRHRPCRKRHASPAATEPAVDRQRPPQLPVDRRDQIVGGAGYRPVGLDRRDGAAQGLQFGASLLRQLRYEQQGAGPLEQRPDPLPACE